VPEERGLTRAEVSDVYRRYGALLARRCRLLVRDRALAEDALQELLTLLLRRGQAMREAESPYRWLCRAADTACLDLLRRRRHVQRSVDLDEVRERDELDRIGPAPGVDPEARLAVLESLERLDESQQALAIMLFVDGLSQGEAAAEIGVSRVTVNKRTQEIRALLRLDQTGDPPSREEVRS